ncbi:MAG: cytochrome c [Planctomycetota bacterium]|nr:MAG: cytochrome c [Planctomycetota bacterium]
MQTERTRSLSRWWLVGVASLGGICVVACLSPDVPLSEEQLAAVETLDCNELTYENFGRPFFEAYCLRCHNQDLKSDFERTDAPQGINFNTLESARPFMQRIRLRAGVQGDMPPQLLVVPHPSDEQRQRLIRWIDCGMPSAADGETP